VTRHRIGTPESISKKSVTHHPVVRARRGLALVLR
jgi:hypothetical protein